MSRSHEDRLLMHRHERRQPGQALVIMVLAVGMVLAATAVVLDGGNAMAQQRGTQNAADAAALAGAVVIGQNFTGAARTDANVLSAVQTAFTNNAAVADTSYYVDFDLNQLATVGSGAIPATASGVEAHGQRSFNTLMASLIGQPTWTAGATATAVAGSWKGTCDPDGAAICVPVVFSVPIISCDGTNRPLTIGGDWTSIGDPSQATADNESIVPLCNTGPGGVGWVQLPGCPTNLKDEIYPPCADGFTLPTWLQTNPGNSNSAQVQNAINQYDGSIILVPMFDSTCREVPVSGLPGDCTDPGNGNNLWYHIPQVAPFLLDHAYINGNPPNCNQAPGQPLVGGNGKTSCFKGWFVNEMLTGEVGEFVPCDENDDTCTPPIVGTQLVR